MSSDGASGVNDSLSKSNPKTLSNSMSNLYFSLGSNLCFATFQTTLNAFGRFKSSSNEIWNKFLAPLDQSEYSRFEVLSCCNSETLPLNSLKACCAASSPSQVKLRNARYCAVM